MEFLNQFTGWFDALDKNLQMMWNQSGEIYTSLGNLAHQIDSMAQYIQNLQTYMTAILVLAGIQFIVILWMWAGQMSIKKELSVMRAEMKGWVKDE